jgi:hypothetical protein
MIVLVDAPPSRKHGVTGIIGITGKKEKPKPTSYEGCWDVFSVHANYSE